MKDKESDNFQLLFLGKPLLWCKKIIVGFPIQFPHTSNRFSPK